ncbi:MAG TPA: DUF418 domain-containing protein [Gemmatimonadota bacterium]|nr:DUF418 domain-containing protein [Gemmatimonadota bacterium]
MPPEPTVAASLAPSTLTSPVAAQERIHALDILRGLAVLGMILVHFHFYANDFHDLSGPARTTFEELVSWGVWLLVETKAAAVFAFLFGVGFAIQIRRAAARGASFVPLYVRRLVVLGLFGFVTHAFFGYNILLLYAYAGLWLLAVRTWSPKALLGAAVIAAMLPGLWGTARRGYDWAALGPDGAKAAAEARAEAATERAQAVNAGVEAAEAQASYAVTVRVRLEHMRWFYSQRFFLLPGSTLFLFLLGMAALGYGVFEDPQRRTRVIAGCMLYGVLAWAASRWLLPVGSGRSRLGWLGEDLRGGMGLLQESWLALTYIGAVLLLLAHRRGWTGRLAPMGWVGRMALTNYLLQIVILDVLFARYGFGLEIREALVVPATIVLFAGEVALSRFWLGRFRFGPAEWLWRSLTYGRLQPLARLEPSPVVFR